MSENLRGGVPLLGHPVRSPLAHPYAVSIPVSRNAGFRSVNRDRELAGAQPELLPEFPAGITLVSYLDFLNSAPSRMRQDCELSGRCLACIRRVLR